METQKKIVAPLFGFLTLIFSFIAIAGWIFQTYPLFWIALVLAVVSLAIFGRLRFSDVMNFFVSRQARYGANVAMSIAGVIGIAVFINAIVVQRFDKKADLTELQLYTLSEESRTILSSLKKDINVTAFFTDNHLQAARARDMLALYQQETSHLNVSFKNPEIDIQLSNKYNISWDGTTIFESGERQERITVVEEQKFTSAILKLIRDETKKIYFLVGHEERGLEDFNNNGYSGVRSELENQNYATFPLSLLTAPDIPADCELLVIAGPKTPLTRSELDTVSKYLRRNGKLLMMLDPSVTSAEDVNRGLARLMRRWGITIGNDLVIDESQFIPLFGPEAPVPAPELHEITRSMRELVAFPYARSVSPTPIENRPANLNVRSLMKTTGGTGKSWAETRRSPDGTFGKNFTYTPGTDRPPPVSVAVAAEQTPETNTDSDTVANPTRIVVFGDSDFAANVFFRAPSRDLLLSAINWLTLEEDLIAIRPIDLQGQTLRQMQVHDVRLVQITSVFLVPALIFIAGLIVWWQRRKGADA